MSKRRVIYGEKHHWWPASVSRHWVNEDRLVNMIRPNGEVMRGPPGKIARITDAHNIRHDSSEWDHTYEHVFDSADKYFPEAIRMLSDTRIEHMSRVSGGKNRFWEYGQCDLDLDKLVGCLVSLAVRSPKIRNQVVTFVTNFRSSVKKQEMSNLISLNLHRLQCEITSLLSGHGKIVLIFTDSREFIFGDGFYNNISMGGVEHSLDVRMLVPITPNIAVLYFKPMAYTVTPRLTCLAVDDELVSLINSATQIYAKDFLFYRFDRPEIHESFAAGQHQKFARADPLDSILFAIPGVLETDRWKFSIT